MPTLAERLIQRIRARGPIPFDEFMGAALYDRESGYYASGKAEIGRKGDFYTSVSIGPIFGRLLARQFLEMWQRLGSPAHFTIIEQGAHNGQFARDAMSFLQEVSQACFAAITYLILEPSVRQQTVQRENLEDFAGKFGWRTGIGEVGSFNGVHFSNELIDAMPVLRVRWNGERWRELHVGEAEEGFAFVEADLRKDERLDELLRSIPQPLDPGHTTEINLHSHAWIAALGQRLQRGWLLAIDYGHPRHDYYDASRKHGTLAAYAEHRRLDDPLKSPGEADLTAHVEFTSLAETALRSGLTLEGFVDQHHLMVGLSRLHFVDTGAAPTPEQQKELRGFHSLMHPGLMGRAFRAICFGKDVSDATPLSGFSFGSSPASALGIS